MLFGRYWPWAASSTLGLGLLACMVALAWSCQILHNTICCCCGRRERRSEEELLQEPLHCSSPSSTHPGKSRLHESFLCGTSSPPSCGYRILPKEGPRTLRTGRRLNDLIIKIEGEAARLQLDRESSSRIDRHGLLFKYSRVKGATTRRLREQLENQNVIHLCKQDGCTHSAGLHCSCYAAVDCEALVDLGAYGGFSAWRLGVLLARAGGALQRVLHRGCVWCRYKTAGSGDPWTRSPSQRRRSSMIPAKQHEWDSKCKGSTRPSHQRSVGTELLQSLLDFLNETKNFLISGEDHARLCNHHKQLYMLSCQGRKCAEGSFQPPSAVAHTASRSRTSHSSRAGQLHGDVVLIRIKPYLGEESRGDWFIFQGIIAGIAPDSRWHDRLCWHCVAPSFEGQNRSSLPKEWLQQHLHMVAVSGLAASVCIHAALVPEGFSNSLNSWDGIEVVPSGSLPGRISDSHRELIQNQPSGA